MITIPRLPQDPPNLLGEEEERPALPKRPAKEVEATPTPPPKPVAAEPEPINDFWSTEARRQQEEFEAEQQRLQQQWEDQQRQQILAQQQAQLDFEEQQRLQAEQQRLAQEQLMREQYQTQTQGRLAELEQENLNARAQYERDQLMLQQYDRRVKDLEEQMNHLTSNLNMQSASKDDQIRSLQEQVNTWRSKYEALAKLYSQLRQEHLDLLQTTKSLKLKAASAQEAIERREKLERELKTKNLELADMIRERDRAYHDRDRLTGTNKDELEKVQRELRFALERAENAERQKGTEISSMLSKYNREMADLEESLRVSYPESPHLTLLTYPQNKSRALEEYSTNNEMQNGDHKIVLQEKETELEAMQAAMDEALLELEELKLVRLIFKVAGLPACANSDYRTKVIPIKHWILKLTTSCTVRSQKSTISWIRCFKLVFNVLTTHFMNLTRACRLVTRMLPLPTFSHRLRKRQRQLQSSLPLSTITSAMVPTVLMPKLFEQYPTFLGRLLMCSATLRA